MDRTIAASRPALPNRLPLGTRTINVSAALREQRKNAGQCLQCGSSSHYKRSCPDLLRLVRQQTSTISQPFRNRSRPPARSPSRPSDPSRSATDHRKRPRRDDQHRRAVSTRRSSSERR
ncbi:hypothetical protein PLESTF_001081300 [Pleodorina starrii]|nr:hypothetical protein PLESTF_001081300 [Pleodorina starrii]